MCVRSEDSFVVGAADAREVSVADAGEVACGTPEFTWGVCADNEFDEKVLMNSVGVVI